MDAKVTAARNKRVDGEAIIVAALFRVQRDAERLGCFRCPPGGRMPMDSTMSEYETLLDFSRVLITYCCIGIAAMLAAALLPSPLQRYVPLWASIVLSVPLALVAALMTAVRGGVVGFLNDIFSPCYELWLDGRKLVPPRATRAASEHADRAAWELSVTAEDSVRDSCVLRVRFTENGRLGNWLLQYAVARLRAASIDVRFECPPGFLGPPFESLSLAVDRWVGPGSVESSAGRPRHRVLLRPRCGGGKSDATDAMILAAYTAAGSDGGASTLGAARSLHASLSATFNEAVVPTMLALPAVVYVSDTGLFVGAEAEVSVERPVGRLANQLASPTAVPFCPSGAVLDRSLFAATTRAIAGTL